MPEKQSRITTGHFDEAGCPVIPFYLCGVAHELPGVRYEGIVDTGFSGFIQIPFDTACELKLPLFGTVGNVLADGSRIFALSVLGRASVPENGNRTDPVTGAVQVSLTSGEILLGMEFLRAFNKGLGIFENTVFLLPSKDEDPD